MEDRTSEFLSLARSLPGASTGSSSLSQGRYGQTAPDTSSGNSKLKNPAIAQLASFHTTAAGISRDIGSTSALLAELTQLVRQKSLFQDDTQQVNDLVLRIKSSMQNLNGRLDDSQRALNQHKRQLGAKSQVGQEASNVVGQLQEELGHAAAGFKTVLQQRTDGMKETSDRKKQIYDNSENQDVSLLSLENKPPVYESSAPLLGATGGGMGASGGGIGATGFPTLDLTSAMTAGESTSSGSQLPRPHGASTYDNGMRLRKSNTDPIPTYSGSQSTYYSRQDSTPLTPYDMQRMEEENNASQMMQLIPDQDYLRERADAMEQVESNIVELGTIFNKLAVMVGEHKEMVQRVEDNVDDANTTISLSLNTLTDTLTNLQTNRALFFKVFSILVVFIIMFIVFFA